MAINFFQQKERQRNLIFVFAGIILIIIFVFWQGFLKEKPAGPSEEFPEFKKKIEIDLEILSHSSLKELLPFPRIEPFQESTSTDSGTAQKIGRDNPFTPY